MKNYLHTLMTFNLLFSFSSAIIFYFQPPLIPYWLNELNTTHVLRIIGGITFSVFLFNLYSIIYKKINLDHLILNGLFWLFFLIADCYDYLIIKELNMYWNDVIPFFILLLIVSFVNIFSIFYLKTTN